MLNPVRASQGEILILIASAVLDRNDVFDLIRHERLNCLMRTAVFAAMLSAFSNVPTKGTPYHGTFEAMSTERAFAWSTAITFVPFTSASYSESSSEFNCPS